MKKRIISILLAVVLILATTTVAVVGVSAAVDADGRYTPSSTVTKTSHLVFFMPEDWYNEELGINEAGAYWWGGADSCGDVAGESQGAPWPGYKMQIEDPDYNLFYVDFPMDDPDGMTPIVFNNYFDGGEATKNDDGTITYAKSEAEYKAAKQVKDWTATYYSEGDCDFYDNLLDGEFFALAEEALEGDDKSFFGEYENNFFDHEEWGISMNFDNMVYVIDPALSSANFQGKETCVGEWYFYYGNGEYGPLPNKEMAEENGLVSKLAKTPVAEETTAAPTEAPTTEEVTEAPTTEEVTEAPTPVEAPFLKVTATSNYFPEVVRFYNEETKQVTVTYYFESSKDVLDVQWFMYYDPTVLVPAKNEAGKNINTRTSLCPAIGAGAGPINLEGTGKEENDGLKSIRYSATNLGLFDFSSEEKIFATAVFDVVAAEPTETTVDLYVDTLRVSALGDDDMTDAAEEVMLVNSGVPQASSVTTSNKTEATPSTAEEVVATTPVPTEAPTTAEPTQAPTEAPTEAPTPAPTQAPTTVAPTVAPTTAAPTQAPTQAPTEAPSRVPVIVADETTVPQPAPTVISETKPASPSEATPSTANGAIQTGSFSMFIVIITIFAVAAGAVVFTRRRFE